MGADDASPDLVTTRLGWQAVAEHVLAAALHQANGHIGLRATPGGFGTPWFEPAAGSPRRRLRVDGLDLVIEDGRDLHRTALTTVGGAAEAVGIVAGAPADVYTPATPLEPDRPLDLDGAAAQRLASFYAVVNQALVDLGRPEDPEAQLWPEHFDLARGLGHVNYGGSPGDATHTEPYLYVGPWDPPAPDGGYWNEPFGASLPAPATLTADQTLAFFREGQQRLSH
jgi:hypothetical protein